MTICTPEARPVAWAAVGRIGRSIEFAGKLRARRLDPRHPVRGTRLLIMTPISLPQAGIVSFSEICRQLTVAAIDQRGRLLEFVRENRARISPVPDDDWMCSELVVYYLDCITQTDHDVEVLTPPFEAADALVQLFNWLLLVPADGQQRAAEIAVRLAERYRDAAPEIRNRIETGFLEHALETPEARPIFDFWSRDPVLAESYSAALAWGLAHSARRER